MVTVCAVSDIHGEVSACYQLKEHIETNNISNLLLLGDYSATIGDLNENREDIKSIMNIVGELATVYAVPGNCDARDVVKVLRSFGIYSHNTQVRIGDFSAILYGGSNPTPFNTPWEVDEETIYSDLKALFSANSQDPTILAVHAPPLDTACDIIPGNIHVGSSSIRAVIEEFQPAYVVCSHIHECSGREDTIGNSRIVNIGLLSQGHIVNISMEDIKHITL
ncbi:metallophosphoesterase [Planctomycetota bacterium]